MISIFYFNIYQQKTDLPYLNLNRTEKGYQLKLQWVDFPSKLMLKIQYAFHAYYFIMQNPNSLWHTILLKTQKELHSLRLRQQLRIPNTPPLTLTQLQNHQVRIQIPILEKEPLQHLKDLGSSPTAFNYGQQIVRACVALAPIFGYFIINENMIFTNQAKEIFVWINPDILQNQVKIYLPPTEQGQKMMIRSIVTFLKLWLRCDYLLLAQANRLVEMVSKVQPVRIRPSQFFRQKHPTEVIANRSCSVNIENCRMQRRFETAKITFKGSKDNDNLGKIVTRTRSPGQESQKVQYPPGSFMFSLRTTALSSAQSKMKKGRASATDKLIDVSDKSEAQTLNSTSLHNQSKLTINNSGGFKSYFPNRTTANKNHIVRMILEHDTDPDNFGKNNIMLDEQKMKELQQQKLRRLKESLHDIGEDVNDLFQSNIIEDCPMNMSGINRDFASLLE